MKTLPPIGTEVDLPPIGAEVEARSEAPEPSLLERGWNFVRGNLPATKSPIGAVANLVTGGRYEDIAPEYGGVYQAPLPKIAPQQPGESDQDFSRRIVRESLRDPQGRGMALAGLIASRLSDVNAPAVPAGPGRLEKSANKLAASTLKGTAGEYKALGPEDVQNLGRWLLENKAVRFGSTPGDVLKRIGPLREAAGSNLDTALGALDATGGTGLDRLKLRDSFLDAALEESKMGPSREPIVNKYLDAAAAVEKDAAQSGATGTFSQGELYKRGYQATAYPKGKPPIEPTPAQVADQNIASIARQHVEDAASQANGPAAEQFVQAKRDYGAAKTAERLLGGAEGRAEARNLASPSDKAAFLAELLRSGDPLSAAALAVANKFTRERAASSIAATLNALSKRGPPGGAVASAGTRGALLNPPAAMPFDVGLPGAAASPPKLEGQDEYGRNQAPAHENEPSTPKNTPASQIVLQAIKSGTVPPSLGRYAPALQAAASRGPDALAAAHYLLYNSDEGYRAGLEEMDKGKAP